MSETRDKIDAFLKVAGEVIAELRERGVAQVDMLELPERASA